jgi:hypothetical protein
MLHMPYFNKNFLLQHHLAYKYAPKISNTNTKNLFLIQPRLGICIQNGGHSKSILHMKANIHKSKKYYNAVVVRKVFDAEDSFRMLYFRY